MKFNYKEVGLYSIILVLLYSLFTFVSQLKYGSHYTPIRLSALFGQYYILFIILAIASIVSIFWKYKYRWIVVSLPFFYTALYYLPSLFTAIAEQSLTGLTIYSVHILLGLSAILYLFIKGIKDIKNLTYEITFAIIIFILFVIRFLI